MVNDINIHFLTAKKIKRGGRWVQNQKKYYQRYIWSKVDGDVQYIWRRLGFVVGAAKGCNGAGVDAPQGRVVLRARRPRRTDRQPQRGPLVWVLLIRNQRMTNSCPSWGAQAFQYSMLEKSCDPRPANTPLPILMQNTKKLKKLHPREFNYATLFFSHENMIGGGPGIQRIDTIKLSFMIMVLLKLYYILLFVYIIILYNNWNPKFCSKIKLFTKIHQSRVELFWWSEGKLNLLNLGKAHLIQKWKHLKSEIFRSSCREKKNSAIRFDCGGSGGGLGGRRRYSWAAWPLDPRLVLRDDGTWENGWRVSRLIKYRSKIPIPSCRFETAVHWCVSYCLSCIVARWGK